MVLSTKGNGKTNLHNGALGFQTATSVTAEVSRYGWTGPATRATGETTKQTVGVA